MSNQDYKNTLNLPSTEFPMKANLPQREPKQLQKWQAQDIYGLLRKNNKNKPKFILHLGPPYANGDIHIGHAVTTVLKDIIVKYKTFSGFDAPLVPGWDCHGLPIEINVEKKKGIAGKEIREEDFRQACREYASSQVALQKESFIRLGVMADWQNPYLTMAPEYEANVVRSLGKILQNGYLIKGAKPVHWCINCASALAEAEVEYQNKQSPAIDVAFQIASSGEFLQKIAYPHSIESDIFFVIWTTTPWTLPANQAVALHPDLEYSMVRAQSENKKIVLCVATELLASCMARFGCQEYQVLTTFQGKQAEHSLLQHPFLNREVPIILAQHVTTDTGTGAVHTAPAHGLEDYAAGLRYKLPVDNPVLANGCFEASLPYVGGQYIFKANDSIIEILKEKNRLLHHEALSHSYPHCWRHKTPVIFRATSQWFISMEKHELRESTLKEVQTVDWIPQWGQSRMSLMIEGRPDWCISRQRTWGVPLTLVLHKKTGEIHPQMQQIIEDVAKKMDKEGIEAWYNLDLNTLAYENIQEYEKAKDVLDVWFESGVSHTCVVKARDELQFPADLYLEGSDQHRGWFQSSLLTSMTMYQQAPYRAVLTHGFTVDAQGRKMSKSLGNVVAPENVIKTLGADVLRLWVSSTDYKNEIHVSDEILKRMADAYRRIRNTLRFMLANLDGFTQEQLVPKEQLIALDAWIVDYAAQLQQEILDAYESYQFHHVYQKIHNFCIVELGSFYLDVIKDRQYTTPKFSLARRSTQTAIYYIAHCLTRLLAPILSFTAEEVWEHLPGAKENSIFENTWLESMPRLDNSAKMNSAFWQKVIDVRNCVNKALENERTQGKIGAPLDAKVIIYASSPYFDTLRQLENELKFVLITSQAEILPFEQAGSDCHETELKEIKVKVEPLKDKKCIRCWHRSEKIGEDNHHPELCPRCIVNIADEQTGEQRCYA